MCNLRFAWVFFRYGVAAGVEHLPVLRGIKCRTVLDIGAHCGQFSLVATYIWPDAKIIAFEPLSKPARTFLKVFQESKKVKLHQVAVGEKRDIAHMHVAKQNDSSSLLPISKLQVEIFPNTYEEYSLRVDVFPLDDVIEDKNLERPVLLKIDVQGYELQTLRGAEKLLEMVDYVYVECSFVELYAGQALASDVIEYLQQKGFRLKGIYNVVYYRGTAVQGDFLFSKI